MNPCTPHRMKRPFQLFHREAFSRRRSEGLRPPVHRQRKTEVDIAEPVLSAMSLQPGTRAITPPRSRTTVSIPHDQKAAFGERTSGSHGIALKVAASPALRKDPIDRELTPRRN